MPRTTNPLANLFQAMGQCSTTPAEQSQFNGHGQHAAAHAEAASHGSRSDRSRHAQHASKASSRSSYHTAHQSGSQQYQARDDYDVHMSDAGSDNVAAKVALARQANRAFEQAQRRSRSRSTSRRRAPSPGPKSAPATPSGTRGEGPTILATPPKGSEKKRCYRLNLEVNPVGVPSVDPATGQHIFGPLIYDPPAHHLSAAMRRSTSWHSLAAAGMRNLHVSTAADLEDDDKSESNKDDMQIAIDTAGIFRGIKVDAKTGTILSQNARASRSAKKAGGDSAGKKVGEKSRQAAKIDKAKDLVDEDGDGGIVS